MKFFKLATYEIYFLLSAAINLIFTSLIISMPVNAQTLGEQQQIIQSPVRTEQDREMDTKRKPLEMLNFLQIKSGMKVLDIFSGAGYTAQLLAIAVGPNGQVVAMNTKPNTALQQRLLAHPQSNLTPAVSDLM